MKQGIYNVLNLLNCLEREGELDLRSTDTDKEAEIKRTLTKSLELIKANRN